LSARKSRRAGAAHPLLRRLFTAAGLVFFLLAAWVATATAKNWLYFREIGRQPYNSSAFRVAVKQVWATLIDSYYDWRLEHDGVLPTYEIELSDRRHAEWRQMLERVYARGYSTPEDQVYLPARLAYHGREWEIDLRGRGTLYTHYRKEKPSMRVRFPGEQYLRGNRQINLVIPYDQARINVDTSIGSLGRQYGLLTYPTRFVNVKLNDEMLGVYQEIEHFREELGVKQYRSEGFFMSGLGEMKGGAALEKNKRLATAAQAIAACARGEEKAAGAKPAFEGANLIDKAHQGLGIQNAGACDEARIRELADLYLDLDKMAIYAAITSAFNAAHAWGEDNLILFFDPPRGRFEPVPWDMGSLWLNAKKGDGPERLESLKGLGAQLMRLPEFRERRDFWLRDIVARKEGFMKREAERRYREIKPALDYDTEHTRRYAERMVGYFDQGITKNFELWRGALAAGGAAAPTEAAAGLPTDQATPSLEERARLAVPPAVLGKVGIETDDGGTTWVLSGTIRLNETLALPEGIHVRFEPGMRLEMAGGTTLVIRGDLVSKGTKERPIEILGYEPDKPFNNFVVFGRSTRKARVVLEHTTFRNGSEGEWNSAYMTGMVSFYDASLRMSDSAIVDVKGEDGLNVKFGMVDVKNIVIDGTFSDSFDCDFCTGVVENILIKNSKADGLDVSGSLILSRGNTMQDLADKGHSVGENSAILILDNLAMRPFTGVSVKDRSWAEIRGGKVVGAQIGISSYQKKPVFGGGVTGFEGRVEEGLTTRFMLDPNAWVTVLPPVPPTPR
jgi:hypothetical protein